MVADETKETWVATPALLVSSAPRAACLIHIYPSGPNMGRRYPLAQSPLVVGRGEDCDLCIADNSISRKHVRFESTLDGFRLTDLGSKNGTFVNDRQLDAPRNLQDGDNIRIGNLLFRFLTGGNIEADYHEEIFRLTLHDGLTQVHNRRALTEFLDRELARSQRHNRPLSVLMFDIDRFKAINDTRGHLCGDTVLRELAQKVAGTVRKEDLFARYGGEEFCMVLVETSLEEATDAGERLRAAIESLGVSFEGQAVPITVSVGVASATAATGFDSATLLRRADENLYRAKQTGRNRVVA